MLDREAPVEQVVDQVSEGAAHRASTDMDSPATESTHTSRPVRPRLQVLAAALAAAIALLYLLLYLDVLSIAGASAEDRRILGVAAGLFVVLGILVWWRRSRLLWGAIAVVQVLMGGMYVAIAPERDPSFDVWGVTIRVLSLGLLVVVVKLLLDTRGDEPGRAR